MNLNISVIGHPPGVTLEKIREIIIPLVRDPKEVVATIHNEALALTLEMPPRESPYVTVFCADENFLDFVCLKINEELDVNVIPILTKRPLFRREIQKKEDPVRH